MILKMEKYSKFIKISHILDRDVVYIGSTCDTLSKCMSNFRIRSNSRVNWAHDKFYLMIRQSFINCEIELIQNIPCNNAEELRNKQNKIYDKLTKKNQKIKKVL